MHRSGLRTINGVSTVSLEGLWEHVSTLEPQRKLSGALEYAGCEFFDEEQHFVKGNRVSLVGLGGVPISRPDDRPSVIQDRLESFVDSTRSMMASSAAFSYLNSGNKELPQLYRRVADLGHFSVAHTVYVNLLVAGITEATEVELSLQRDIVHISKLTNTRTTIQSTPPVVVADEKQLAAAKVIRATTQEATDKLREDGHDADSLEIINGWYPVNKATILMLSGDLSNLRKLVALQHDAGKESELRSVARSIGSQLALLWPEIFNKDGGK